MGRPLGQQHQGLLDTLVIALEHLDDDLKIGQGLRQSVLDVDEQRIELVERRRTLAQQAAQRRVLLLTLCRQRFQVRRPPVDGVRGLHLAVQNRWRVVDDAVDVVDVVLQLGDERLGAVDQSLQRRAESADRECGLVEHGGDFVRRNRRQ